MDLTSDLLTSTSVHADVLQCTKCLPTLVLIAQAVFLLERGHIDKQTINKSINKVDVLHVRLTDLHVAHQTCLSRLIEPSL